MTHEEDMAALLADVAPYFQPSPSKALPGWAVDRIREGVPKPELRARATKAVFGHLKATAMSAINAGWAYEDWESLLSDSAELVSRLGQQAWRDSRGRRLTPKAHASLLHRAWRLAKSHVDANPRITADEIRTRAKAHHRVITETLDWEVTSRSRDRLVALAVLAEAHRRLRPCLHCRASRAWPEPGCARAAHKGLGCSHDAVVVEVIADAGVSGAKPLAARAGGARIDALLDARKPTVDAIAVARLDRLGRDAAERLALYRRFQTGKVGLVSVVERIDLASPHGRAMAGVSAVFAELERGLIAERTTEVLRAKKAAGLAWNHAPFGWAYGSVGFVK